MTLRPGVRLAVDLGQARVGVARTDPAGLLATPVATLRRDTGAETDMDRIVDLAEETGAIEILVGLPRSMDGAERTSARTVRRWAGRLAGRAGVPVRLVDERLTTVSAHRLMVTIRMMRREGEKMLHAGTVQVGFELALCS